MKRYITLTSLCALAIAAQAQPVLTFASNAPVPGMSYALHYSPHVPPGETGAEQTWNLAGLGTDSIHQISLVQPGSTTNGASFPGSTVAETGAMANMYFRAATEGMYLVGSDADLVIAYEDQGLYMPYPCTYQTTWTDEVSAQFTTEGFDVSRTGVINGEADGYGTLVMPYGEVENVLRIHWHEESVDETESFSFNSVYDSYLYYKVGQSYPLAQLVTTSMTFMGQTTTSSYAQWVEELNTGIEASAPNSSTVDLFPVPTNGTLNIGLPAHFSGAPLVTITDAAGRTVRGMRAATFTGTTGRLDVADLRPGTYQLTAIDEQGQRATRGFIVQ